MGRKISICLAIFGACFWILALLIVIHSSFTGDSLVVKTEEVVKCYDRFSNEIEGLECIDKNEFINDGLFSLIICGAICFGFALGLREI